MHVKKKIIVATGLGIALVLGTAAAPALALGGPTTVGGIVGKSWIQGSNTDALTFSNIGSATLTVQLTSAGVLVAGTKVTTSGSPATYSTIESFYLAGGRHTGAGHTFNT